MRQVLYRCVAALCVCTGSVMAWQCAQTGTNETGCRWGQPWIYMFTSLIPFFVPHQRDKNSVLLELESDLKGLLWPWGCRDLEDSSLRVRSEFSDSVIWCIWRRGSQHKGLSKGVLRCVQRPAPWFGSCRFKELICLMATYRSPLPATPPAPDLLSSLLLKCSATEVPQTLSAQIKLLFLLRWF